MPHDQAYLEAEKKIGQALQSGATKLDLSGSKDSKLTEIPDSLWKLTQLTKLDLSNNQLTTLPPSLAALGALTQLTELNLSRNQLTPLPDSLAALGALTQLTELDLSNNQLTTLPPSLGQLTQLQLLNLGQNKLTVLPDCIWNLLKLKELELYSNNLTIIPDSIGKLKFLENLVVNANQLSALPDELSKLSSLRELHLGRGLGGNPFVKLPPCIRSLRKLSKLNANDCKLTSLPDWLGELSELNFLDAHSNGLTDIPPSLAQLEHLETLDLSKNPLNPALQSAYDACNKSGYTHESYAPLWAYLRSLETNAEPLYEAKLVLVGEGNVGKTTLLKALKGKAGEAPQEHEPTTHGVEIDFHGLRLPHPAKDGVEIQLNAWDFGGQDVYRVTHQFFFSRRSLYLLVWEPRRGVQQGQVEDWLNMIRLRVGDDARVIIVSTHCKTGERIARIDQPVFKQQYGDMIVGFHEVDRPRPRRSHRRDGRHRRIEKCHRRTRVQTRTNGDGLQPRLESRPRRTARPPRTAHLFLDL
jgi:GTPase SAR1 family protein